jgi:poly(3-hydroxybutyrate) depolymerase
MFEFRPMAAGALGAMVWMAAAAFGQAEAYTIDPDSISVSGVSSGADFAHQLHIAHSSRIHGVGLVAASPYHCARGDTLRAMQVCSAAGAKLSLPYLGPPTPADVDALVADTAAAFGKGSIDDPAGVKTARIYLFSGSLDSVVPPPVAATVKEYYEKLGAKDVVFDNKVAAEHAMITVNSGSACNAFGTPYINHCEGVDVAGRILKHIYRNLADKSAAKETNLITFGQAAFFSDGLNWDLDIRGHLYVPTACAQGARCRLHIVFEGCEQNQDQIGDQFYTTAGYNEWAETNNIIVMYPQVRWGFNNPKWCWDWWGYTGADYDTKSARQIVAVMAMIDRVVSGGALPDDPCWGWRSFSCRWQ